MNISFIKMSDLKSKFGKLLSFLYHNANLELDNINNKMIFSSFLDIFEENRLEDFMNMQNEDIARELFLNINVINSSSNDIGELYWSGIQYINLFLNYRIPLRTLFLVCPLKEMIKKYEIYHEMNEIEVCKDIIANEYEHNSILGYFRKRDRYSVRELSILANVPSTSIKYYEKYNGFLFGASNETISSFKRVLNIPHALLKRKSSFLPININTLEDKDFKESLLITFSNYLNRKVDDLVISFDEPKQKMDNIFYFYVGFPSYLRLNNKKIFLEDSLLDNIFSLAIDDYLKNNLKANLVF